MSSADLHRTPELAHPLLRDRRDLERARRVRTIQLGTLAMFAVGFAAIARYWQLEVPLIVGALALTMIGAAANLVWLHRGGPATTAGNLSIGGLFCLLMVSVTASGGFYDPNFAWLYAVPVAAAFLVDLRSGWVWLGVVGLAVVGFWTLPVLGITLPNWVPEAEQHEQALFNRLSALLALSALATCFVVTQRRTERELRASHRELLREARSVQLLQQAAMAANEAPSLEAALEQSATRILSSTGWAVALAWLPATDDSGEFVCSGLFVSLDDQRYAPLRRASETLRVRPGERALGKVLAEATPRWTDRGRFEPEESARGRCALSLGLGSAVAIPVISGQEVRAILEFFAHDLEPIDRRLIRVVEEVGHQIGRVAERISLQERLRQSQKLQSVGQLAASIAHEINNPMAYVRANLGMLRSEWAELREEVVKAGCEAALSRRFAECEELIDESLEGVDRTVAIVRDVREFSRASESRTELSDLNELVEASLRVATTKRPDGVSIERSYRGEGVVPCIPSQLQQVFLNLIVNAFQAVGANGCVRVATDVGRSEATVVVEDDGQGIAEADLGRLFDPFFTTKPAGEGTGLGLYISYEIVRGHGGEIRVHSEPGHGARFEVRLPIDGSPERSAG